MRRTLTKIVLPLTACALALGLQACTSAPASETKPEVSADAIILDVRTRRNTRPVTSTARNCSTSTLEQWQKPSRTSTPTPSTSSTADPATAPARPSRSWNKPGSQTSPASALLNKPPRAQD